MEVFDAGCLGMAPSYEISLIVRSLEKVSLSSTISPQSIMHSITWMCTSCLAHSLIVPGQTVCTLV